MFVGDTKMNLNYNPEIMKTTFVGSFFKPKYGFFQDVLIAFYNLYMATI